MKKIFDRLKNIVEHPAFPWLTAYRNDFYKIDRDYLQSTAAPGSRYMWIVRDSGCHLVRLGVHRRQHAELEAVLETTAESAMQIYLVDENHVTEIDVKRAHLELGKYDYRVEGSIVYKGDFPIAGMYLTLTPWKDGQRPSGTVQYVHRAPYLSLKTLIALHMIAEGEVQEQSHSLFTPTTLVALEGQNLIEVIAEQQKNQDLWPTESKDEEKHLNLV
jgi:hypothetical protein